jgi:hypothetical protein
LAAGAAVIAALIARLVGNRAALGLARYGAVALAVLLFLAALRRPAERAGRLAERLDQMEKAHDVQRRMLEAASDRPRDRHELAQRMRDGQF